MDTEHDAEDGGEMSGAGTELRDQTLRLLSELPGMIVSSGANLDYAINVCLMRVGTLFSASRGLVMLDEKDGKYLRNTHE